MDICFTSVKKILLELLCQLQIWMEGLIHLSILPFNKKISAWIDEVKWNGNSVLLSGYENMKNSTALKTPLDPW